MRSTETTNGRPPRDRNVASCSQKKALLVTGAVLAVLVGIALLIAYAGPTDCPCARSLLGKYNADGTNGSEKFEPYATNGQPFPWLLQFLPPNIRPNRYTILIHPNLTTFEVKGECATESQCCAMHSWQQNSTAHLSSFSHNRVVSLLSFLLFSHPHHILSADESRVALHIALIYLSQYKLHS